MTSLFHMLICHFSFFCAPGAHVFCAPLGHVCGQCVISLAAVQWNESDGAISRRYVGFRNSGQNLARFDCLASRYLIVGDEGLVKVSSS